MHTHPQMAPNFLCLVFFFRIIKIYCLHNFFFLCAINDQIEQRSEMIWIFSPKKWGKKKEKKNQPNRTKTVISSNIHDLSGLIEVPFINVRFTLHTLSIATMNVKRLHSLRIEIVRRSTASTVYLR